ncbi:MAG: leucine-rich repeat domain-containing protein [Sulfitobacter sp.]
MTKAQDAYSEAQHKIVQNPSAFSLELSNEWLECIPPEIISLTNVTKLDLSDTKIKSAKHLANLTKLTELNLNYTKLASTKHLASLTNLTELNLGGTKLKSAEHVRSLTNLTELDLHSQA